MLCKKLTIDLLFAVSKTSPSVAAAVHNKRGRARLLAPTYWLLKRILGNKTKVESRSSNCTFLSFDSPPPTPLELGSRLFQRVCFILKSNSLSPSQCSTPQEHCIGREALQTADIENCCLQHCPIDFGMCGECCWGNWHQLNAAVHAHDSIQASKPSPGASTTHCPMSQ